MIDRVVRPWISSRSDLPQCQGYKAGHPDRTVYWDPYPLSVDDDIDKANRWFHSGYCCLTQSASCYMSCPIPSAPTDEKSEVLSSRISFKSLLAFASANFAYWAANSWRTAHLLWGSADPVRETILAIAALNIFDSVASPFGAAPRVEHRYCTTAKVDTKRPVLQTSRSPSL